MIAVVAALPPDLLRFVGAVFVIIVGGMWLLWIAGYGIAELWGRHRRRRNVREILKPYNRRSER